MRNFEKYKRAWEADPDNLDKALKLLAELYSLGYISIIEEKFGTLHKGILDSIVENRNPCNFSISELYDFATVIYKITKREQLLCLSRPFFLMELWPDKYTFGSPGDSTRKSIAFEIKNLCKTYPDLKFSIKSAIPF